MGPYWVIFMPVNQVNFTPLNASKILAIIHWAALRFHHDSDKVLSSQRPHCSVRCQFITRCVVSRTEVVIFQLKQSDCGLMGRSIFIDCRLIHGCTVALDLIIFSSLTREVLRINNVFNATLMEINGLQKHPFYDMDKKCNAIWSSMH